MESKIWGLNSLGRKRDEDRRFPRVKQQQQQIRKERGRREKEGLYFFQHYFPQRSRKSIRTPSHLGKKGDYKP